MVPVVSRGATQFRLGTNVLRSARTRAIQIPDDLSTVESAAAARTAPEWNPTRNPLYSGRIEPARLNLKSALQSGPSGKREWSGPLQDSPQLISLSCLVLSYIGIFPCFFSSNQLYRALIHGFSTPDSSYLPLARIISWVPSTSKGHDINIPLLFLVLVA